MTKTTSRIFQFARQVASGTGPAAQSWKKVLTVDLTPQIRAIPTGAGTYTLIRLSEQATALGRLPDRELSRLIQNKLFDASAFEVLAQGVPLPTKKRVTVRQRQVDGVSLTEHVDRSSKQVLATLTKPTSVRTSIRAATKQAQAAVTGTLVAATAALQQGSHESWRAEQRPLSHGTTIPLTPAETDALQHQVTAPLQQRIQQADKREIYRTARMLLDPKKARTADYAETVTQVAELQGMEPARAGQRLAGTLIRASGKLAVDAILALSVSRLQGDAGRRGAPRLRRCFEDFAAHPSRKNLARLERARRSLLASVIELKDLLALAPVATPSQRRTKELAEENLNKLSRSLGDTAFPQDSLGNLLAQEEIAGRGRKVPRLTKTLEAARLRCDEIDQAVAVLTQVPRVAAETHAAPAESYAEHQVKSAFRSTPKIRKEYARVTRQVERALGTPGAGRRATGLARLKARAADFFAHPTERNRERLIGARDALVAQLASIEESRYLPGDLETLCSWMRRFRLGVEPSHQGEKEKQSRLGLSTVLDRPITGRDRQASDLEVARVHLERRLQEVESGLQRMQSWLHEASQAPAADKR